MTLPAICLIAVPGRRRRTLELAREIEQRGFAGIFSPSPFGNMSLCEALSWQTQTIPFGTAIAPIYQRTVTDFAQSAAVMQEVSGGRFRLGIGVAHGPSHVRMGVTPGKPLGDIRSFVERFRAQQGLGPLPPIIIAALHLIPTQSVHRLRCQPHMRHHWHTARHQKRNRLGHVLAAFQLYRRRPGLLHHPRCIAKRLARAFLIAAKRHINHHHGL